MERDPGKGRGGEGARGRGIKGRAAADGPRRGSGPAARLLPRSLRRPARRGASTRHREKREEAG